MGCLFWRFNRVSKKFSKNRERFLEIARDWKISGKAKNANTVIETIKKIESMIIELSVAFSSASNGSFSLFLKTRRLVKLYRDLNEFTTPLWKQIAVPLAIFVFATKYIFMHCAIVSGSAEPTMLLGDHLFVNKLAYRFSKPKRNDWIVFDDANFKYDKSSKLNAWWQRNVGFGLPILGLPDGPSAWVKRLIGVPGDIIEGRIEDGKTAIYRNGEKIYEPYVNPYPLIRLRREVGFINSKIFGAIPILSSLQRRIVRGPQRENDPHDYSYDRSKSFADQPFYFMKESEVVRDPVSHLPMIREPEEIARYDSFLPVRVPEGKYWVMGDSRRNSFDSRGWGLLDASIVRGKASIILFSIDSWESWAIFDLIKHPIKFWTEKVRWKRTMRVPDSLRGLSLK
jgi:signal peptidase I